MPLAPDSYQALDDALNRLATESILASPGRDEGLIPSYSLLGELCELFAEEAILRDAVAAVRAVLDKRLESAQPFDEVSLGHVRGLVDWLPKAIEAAKSGKAPTASAPQDAPAEEVPVAKAEHKEESEQKDVLLELNLGENQELLNEFHAEVVDHLQQIEAALLILDQDPRNQESLNSIFRSFHTIKGNAGFLGLVPMHTLAHEVESLLDLARNNKLRLTPAIITEILRSRDALQALTQQVGLALEKAQLPSKVIPVSHLIRAVKILASGAGTVPEADAPVAAETPAGSAAPSNANSIEAHAMGQASTGQTVRVNTEKLDSLMDVVGELVIVQSQLIESAQSLGSDGTPLHRNVSQLSRIAKELQHTSMSLRMIPIKPTFQKMERLARDLARNFGKKVLFQVNGEDTELDRTVVEEIGDPLVHMMRNALDHGLELPEQRIAAGKSETGTVQLSAYHQGSNLVIELRDDGRGIDPARVLAKARTQGLIGEGVEPPLEDVYKLLFMAGFSTAEKVTSVSGRGVGMDVVKRNIDKLRGKIEITSEVGKGSCFKVKLPLTMAIIDGLVLRVGDDRFILPSTSVQMAIRPAREHISKLQGTGEIFDLRGRLLPLHRLNRRLGIEGRAQEAWEGIVLIVEVSGKACALLVDEMISKQEVVIKNLGAFMQSIPGVAGGAILGDGNIALILDPGALLQAA